jgi:hypothetical protein
MQIRRFLTGLFAAVAMPFAAAQAPVEKLDAREEVIARDLCEQRGVCKILLMNKKIGRLRAIEDGKIVLSVPAITSTERGDTFDKSPGVTPAGIFPLRISPGQDAPDAAMCFAELGRDGKITTCTAGSGNIGYVIHIAANQRRAQILSQPYRYKPETQMRLSAGCINLDAGDYKRISAFAQSAAQTLTTRDGTPVRRDSFLVTLPESDKVEATRNFFGIPAPL